MSATPTFTANTEAQAANPQPATPQRVFTSRTPQLKSEPAFPQVAPLELDEQNKPVFDQHAVDGKLTFASLQLVLQAIYGIKDQKTLNEQAEAIFSLVGLNKETGTINYPQFQAQIATKVTHQYNRQQNFDADVQFTHDINRKKIRGDGEEKAADQEEVDLQHP